MAELPKQVPWVDPIKKAGKLTIFLDGSIGRAGWAQVFKNAIFEFNKLSTDHKLGVLLDTLTGHQTRLFPTSPDRRIIRLKEPTSCSRRHGTQGAAMSGSPFR